MSARDLHSVRPTRRSRQKEESMGRVWVTTSMCTIALALSAAGTYAQSAGGQGDESKVGHRAQTGQGSETQSKQFVEKMLSANMAEIQLGQIAFMRGITVPDGNNVPG